MTLAKFFWVDARPFKKDLVTAALEGGANAVWVDSGFEKDVRALGLISVISPAGDLKPGKEVIEYKIESQRDEDAVVNAPGDSWAVIRCDDWKIIPLAPIFERSVVKMRC